MRFRLARRRTVVLPTFWGWICFLAMVGAILRFWWIHAESFLSPTERLPADVLVVEGWIGRAGVRAAGSEFLGGGYRYIVATSGEIEDHSGQYRWNYTSLAVQTLVSMGIPPDEVIAAPPGETMKQRTFQSAVAVWRALRARGIRPAAVNLFTMGAHARRNSYSSAEAGGDAP